MTIMNDDNREFDEDDNEYNECGQLPSAYLSGMFPLGSGLSRNSALYPLNLVTIIIIMIISRFDVKLSIV